MKPLVVANWKCNPLTVQGAKVLFNSVKNGIKNIKNVEVVICPPSVYLPMLKGLTLGAQDVFWKEKGAYTGEVSPLILKDLGCKYVIIGHSERRKYFKETNEMIEKKMRKTLEVELCPILCIDKISQIPLTIKGNFIIAYEPLFAIGTGKPCSPQKARMMRIKIEKKLKNIPILYGGSVDAGNALVYLADAGFQGLLVGGASLKSKEFIDIIKAVC